MIFSEDPERCWNIHTHTHTPKIRAAITLTRFPRAVEFESRNEYRMRLNGFWYTHESLNNMWTRTPRSPERGSFMETKRDACNYGSGVISGPPALRSNSKEDGYSARTVVRNFDPPVGPVDMCAISDASCSCSLRRDAISLSYVDCKRACPFYALHTCITIRARTYDKFTSTSDIHKGRKDVRPTKVRRTAELWGEVERRCNAWIPCERTHGLS